MHIKRKISYASALSLALIFSAAANAAGDDGTAQNTTPMTGKQKATAIGATTGAVAGAVVGGPVGAVAGAVVGGVVGHQGTDANGKVSNSEASPATRSDSTVRGAQEALNAQGYSVGAVDGQWGPNTSSAVRRFQADKGLAQSGTLDSSTLATLGVSR